jgi:plastocyanin
MEVSVRRKLTAMSAASAVLLGGGLVGAAPANALDRSVALQCSSNTVSFSPSTVIVDTNDTITFTIGGPYALSVTAVGATGPASVSGLSGAPKIYTATGNSGGSLTFTVISSQQGGCSVNDTAVFTFTGSAPAPSGDTSSTPVLDTLSLAVEASGATCTGGNPTG